LLVDVELVAEPEGVVRALAEFADDLAAYGVAQDLNHGLEVSAGDPPRPWGRLKFAQMPAVFPGCKPGVVYLRAVNKFTEWLAWVKWRL
jgi:hypothetical protein